MCQLAGARIAVWVRLRTEVAVPRAAGCAAGIGRVTTRGVAGTTAPTAAGMPRAVPRSNRKCSYVSAQAGKTCFGTLVTPDVIHTTSPSSWEGFAASRVYAGCCCITTCTGQHRKQQGLDQPIHAPHATPNLCQKNNKGRKERDVDWQLASVASDKCNA